MINITVTAGGIPIMLEELIKVASAKQTLIEKILSSECYFIIECKSCCNLFRSVSAFVDHKRTDCTKTTNLTCTDLAVTSTIKPNEDDNQSKTPVNTLACINIPNKNLAISDLRKKLSPTIEIEKAGTGSESSGMQCQQCTKWFPNAGELKSHLLSSCPNMISRKPDISSSQKSYHNISVAKSTTKCDYCDKEFKFQKAKEKHMHSCLRRNQIEKSSSKSANKIFSCEKCHRMYSDETSLQRHIEAIHSETEKMSPNRIESETKPKKRRSSTKSLDASSVENSESTANGNWKNADDDNLDIYCDVENLQCLICFVKEPNLVALKSHIRVEHSSSPALDNRSQNQTNSQLEKMVENLDNYDRFDAEPGLQALNRNPDINENGSNEEILECTICGKRFSDQVQYDLHVSLPHKISIRSTVD